MARVRTFHFPTPNRSARPRARLFVLALIVVLSVAPAASAASGRVEHAGSTTCGLTNGIWRPGRVTRAGFMTDAQAAARARAMARRLHGRARKAELRLAGGLSSEATREAPVCRHLGDPAGARRLAASQVRIVGATRCGEVSGQWVSGELLPSGWFIADTTRSRDLQALAARARGRKRRHDLAAATVFASRAAAGSATCAPAPAGGASGGAAGGASGGAAPPLRFALQGAAGLVLRSATTAAHVARDARMADDATSTGSNLAALLPGGQLQDAISSGSATISRFWVSPTGEIYVLFAAPVALAPASGPLPSPSGGALCELASVDPSTGVPTCLVDETQWPGGCLPSTLPNGDPVQFDASGNLYVLTSDSGICKLVDGAWTMIVNQPQSTGRIIETMSVLSNGTIFASGLEVTGWSAGTTYSGDVFDVPWAEVVSAGGVVQDLPALPNLTGSPAPYFSLGLFPDGNLYLTSGNWDFVGAQVVLRYLPSTGQLDPSDWIGPSTGTPPPHFDNAENCLLWDDASQQQCQEPAGGVSWSETTSDGRVFVTTGPLAATLSLNGNASLYEYYPTVRPVPTAIIRINAAQAVGDDIALAGVDEAGDDLVVLHHTVDDSETTLIGPGTIGANIDVEKLTYQAASHTLLVAGIDTTDGEARTATVDLSTGAVTLGAGTGTSIDWSTFQALH